jgi:TetR/AcrR family acrAB operon transcriptional repressor
MRRTKEQADQTKQDVLNAALKVFSEKGYAAATLNEIAERAGVTRGAIYWHFEHKAELYGMLIEQAGSISAQVVQAAAGEGGELPEILERVFVRLLQAVEDDPSLRATLEVELFKTAEITELSAIQRKHLAAGERLIENIAGVMRSGIQQGYLRDNLDPVMMARAFVGLQNGLIRMWLMAPGSFSLKEQARSLAAIYLNGVRTPR